MGDLSGKRMRLHLGSGDKIWPGFLNCDLHADADVQVDCQNLPFEADYADEIHSIHFVEHIPRLNLENMLMNWHRVLKPGGKIFLELPCLNKIADNIKNGEKNLRLTVMGIFGDPRDPRPGMMHQWAYTQEELTECLLQCGFRDVAVKEPLFHMKQRDMRIEGVKP